MRIQEFKDFDNIYPTIIKISKPKDWIERHPSTIQKKISVTNEWKEACNPKELTEITKTIFDSIKNKDDNLKDLKILYQNLKNYRIYCKERTDNSIIESIKAFFGFGKRVGLEDSELLEGQIHQIILNKENPAQPWIKEVRENAAFVPFQTLGDVEKYFIALDKLFQEKNYVENPETMIYVIWRDRNQHLHVSFKTAIKCVDKDVHSYRFRKLDNIIESIQKDNSFNDRRTISFTEDKYCKAEMSKL